VIGDPLTEEQVESLVMLLEMARRGETLRGRPSPVALAVTNQRAKGEGLHAIAGVAARDLEEKGLVRITELLTTSDIVIADLTPVGRLLAECLELAP
jgi:hypothetical protein